VVLPVTEAEATPETTPEVDITTDVNPGA